jgi:CelD/BcsL family acetyltransferase involved in cellulose biosynthesis
MRVEVIETIDDLVQRIANHPTLLPPTPMQSPQWLRAWWSAYASGGQVHAPAVYDDHGCLRGVAPWYHRESGQTARLRAIGDGPACSDHASLLCHPRDASRVAGAIADWLLAAPADHWSQVQLEAVNSDDTAIGELADQLAQGGAPVHRREEVGTCLIQLAPSWDEYLASVSKNHRKRCRRLVRQFFDTRRAVVKVAQDHASRLAALELLIELHNSRRNSIGEQGAFEDPAFVEFHRAAVAEMGSSGAVHLQTLWIDDQPVAAEYVLQDDHRAFAYQSGISTLGEELGAGTLSLIALVRHAIDSGRTHLDLLRGDEAYKFSWGAQRKAACTLTVHRDSLTGRLGNIGVTLLESARTAKRRLAFTA